MLLLFADIFLLSLCRFSRDCVFIFFYIHTQIQFKLQTFSVFDFISFVLFSLYLFFLSATIIFYIVYCYLQMYTVAARGFMILLFVGFVHPVCILIVHFSYHVFSFHFISFFVLPSLLFILLEFAISDLLQTNANASSSSSSTTTTKWTSLAHTHTWHTFTWLSFPTIQQQPWKTFDWRY